MTRIDRPLTRGIAMINSRVLNSLPHNGAIATLLALCGSTHRESHFDMVASR